jgi:hypothetical protein
MSDVVYHFSEEGDITRFKPRESLSFSQLGPVVWAIDNEHAPLYFFPRDCPRIAIWKGSGTIDSDVQRFSLHTRMAITIQRRWLEKVEHSTIFRYSFPAKGFRLFDENAGYYITEDVVESTGVTELNRLPLKLIDAGVELRVVDSLKALQQDVLDSSFAFSMIRMRNAMLG